ncbi:hypothetical protein PIB30_081522 [Stylosanthes scabra]|uniref:Uncharacterized protein n=1 Tax=Stylosanthes scabra TaxID=79078 RepID=A0ABU6SS60_9FABA|nr:hypothetical protein [Stylosanthes scabra]
MRARLLRQPDLETTKPQPEQGIIAAENQEKKEVEEDADSDSISNLAMNSTTDQQFNFTRSFHKSTIADNEIDAKDAKLERAEITEERPTLLDTEESDGGTIPSNGCTQHPTSSTAVDAVARAREEEAHRPPPKPPNLSSEWVLTDETTDLCLKSPPEASPSKAASVTAGDSNNALEWRQRNHGEADLDSHVMEEAGHGSNAQELEKHERYQQHHPTAAMVSG